MKTILVLALSLAAVSCRSVQPVEWDGSSNPLDTPETFIVRPEAMGRFGPHSEYYNNL